MPFSQRLAPNTICSADQLFEVVQFLKQRTKLRVLCCGAGAHLTALIKVSKERQHTLIVWESNEERLSAVQRWLQRDRVDCDIELRYLEMHDIELRYMEMPEPAQASYGWYSFAPAISPVDVLIEAAELGLPGRWGAGPSGVQLLTPSGVIFVCGTRENPAKSNLMKFWAKCGLTVDETNSTGLIYLRRAVEAEVPVDRVNVGIRQQLRQFFSRTNKA